jgi:hypothetical protein
MPLDSYTWLHDDLTEEERIQLIQWVDAITNLKEHHKV